MANAEQRTFLVCAFTRGFVKPLHSTSYLYQQLHNSRRLCKRSDCWCRKRQCCILQDDEDGLIQRRPVIVVSSGDTKCQGHQPSRLWIAPSSLLDKRLSAAFNLSCRYLTCACSWLWGSDVLGSDLRWHSRPFSFDIAPNRDMVQVIDEYLA